MKTLSNQFKQIIMVVLAMTTLSANAAQSALDLFKQQEKIQTLLSRHPTDKNDIQFGEVELGGNCGIVGCQWQKLVSLVITSKRANAPSLTILAVVTGNTPDRGQAPTVRYVDLQDMDVSKWQTTL